MRSSRGEYRDLLLDPPRLDRVFTRDHPGAVNRSDAVGIALPLRRHDGERDGRRGRRHRIEDRETKLVPGLDPGLGRKAERPHAGEIDRALEAKAGADGRLASDLQLEQGVAVHLAIDPLKARQARAFELERPQ